MTKYDPVGFQYMTDGSPACVGDGNKKRAFPRRIYRLCGFNTK
jgi:hypothetical protein